MGLSKFEEIQNACLCPTCEKKRGSGEENLNKTEGVENILSVKNVGKLNKSRIFEYLLLIITNSKHSYLFSQGIIFSSFKIKQHRKRYLFFI